jgi:hypothetical protein
MACRSRNGHSRNGHSRNGSSRVGLGLVVLAMVILGLIGSRFDYSSICLFCEWSFWVMFILDLVILGMVFQ